MLNHPQACRGDQPDNPVTPCAAGDSESDKDDVAMDTGALYTLPAGADFLMCYSVAEGEPEMLKHVKTHWTPLALYTRDSDMAAF